MDSSGTWAGLTRNTSQRWWKQKLGLILQAERKSDLAEMLARPKKNLLCVICASTSHDRHGHFIGQSARPVNCMVCGETEHVEMDCPYLHGRARHVCDDTCPAKYPSPCLCGNQPTHERDVCPFEPPEKVGVAS